MPWGEALNLALALGLLGCIFWFGRRRTKPKPANVAEDRPDLPYRAYTTEFDVVVRARETPALAADQPRTDNISPETHLTIWSERIDQATKMYRLQQDTDWQASLTEWAMGRRETAILLLIDLSGSMRDRMVTLAGHVRALAEDLDRVGIPFAILGFTTVNWKGGRSRKAWSDSGRPAYPGRLADLLHVVFKDLNEPLNQSDWEAMLNQSLYRENIDGEALEWAVAIAHSALQEDVRLILLSDGAPVDDSTLTQNGIQFLSRHFEQVVSIVQSAGDVKFGAISLDHRMPESVKAHTEIADAVDFPSAFVAMLERLDETGPSQPVSNKN